MCRLSFAALSIRSGFYWADRSVCGIFEETKFGSTNHKNLFCCCGWIIASVELGGMALALEGLYYIVIYLIVFFCKKKLGFF